MLQGLRLIAWGVAKFWLAPRRGNDAVEPAFAWLLARCAVNALELAGLHMIRSHVAPV